MKRIAVLGSTGSIGQTSLQLLSQKKDEFQVVALAAGRNIKLLSAQIDAFRPEMVTVESESLAFDIQKNFPGLQVLHGREGLIKLVKEVDTDLIISGIVGFEGVAPIIAALHANKNLAIANKEALVAAGRFVMKLVHEKRVKFIPLDSEHNALFQLLGESSTLQIQRAILTASGGPFWRSHDKDFENVTPEEAVAHPTWKMGPKISVDSATLMNKGFELLEAQHLFGLSRKQLQVVIHPQSYVHALIQFENGVIHGLVSPPDMKYPIEYALYYPEKRGSPSFEIPLPLGFYSPDLERFPCLRLALDVLDEADSYGVALNAANDVAVAEFLEGRLTFGKISVIIEKVLQEARPVMLETFEDIERLDGEFRRLAFSLINV